MTRELLGLIWSGNVTQWNDERILELNPHLVLPGENITLGYSENGVYSISEVVKRALSSFSSDFSRLLIEANNSFALMPPGQRGTAMSAGTTGSENVAWLKVHTL